jgi:sec-independent protein translocase protein TatC|tara:strand:+ start:7834 stop:8673 length:840 start_codon:yes stop_codon:yes gene_type:complete
MSNTDQNEMNFLQHLEELRWHLIRSIASVLIIAIVAFLNKSFVFDVIIFSPKGADFITYQFLCWLSVQLNAFFPTLISADVLCIGGNIPQLQNLNMSGQFTTHIMISVVTGFVVAFPYIFWEIWRFIKPGLIDKEKKLSRGTVFFSSFLFTTGILFGYFVIAPLSINFFSTYQVSADVANQFTLSTYISTLTTIVLACGVLFELPIVIYFLTRAGLIYPEMLQVYRKHAIVGAFVLSAILTPPDVFSQFLVTIPLAILYEISIVVSRRTVKKIKERAAE